MITFELSAAKPDAEKELRTALLEGFVGIWPHPAEHIEELVNNKYADAVISILKDRGIDFKKTGNWPTV